MELLAQRPKIKQKPTTKRFKLYGRLPATNRNSLTDNAFESYLSSLHGLADTSKATYTRCLKQFYEYVKAEGIVTPSEEDLQAYVNYLDEQGKSEATMQLYVISVKKFFKWLVKKGYYHENIADDLNVPKVNRKEFAKDYLTATQVNMTLDAVTTYQEKQLAQAKERGSKQSVIERINDTALRDYAMIRLMVTAGLRTVEVSRADIGDLKTRGGKLYLYVQGKGRRTKDARVHIAPHTEKAIYKYLSTRKDTQAHDPLFPSNSNRNQDGRLTAKSVNRIVNSYFIEAGIKTDTISPHSLRHSFATIMRASGMTKEEAQVAMRHESIKTLEFYDHTDDVDNNRGAYVVDEVLSLNK